MEEGCERLEKVESRTSVVQGGGTDPVWTAGVSEAAAASESKCSDQGGGGRSSSSSNTLSFEFGVDSPMQMLVALWNEVS